MLVIKRKMGESFKVTAPTGETLVITVTKASPSEVKLSCDGPRSMEVTRLEKEKTF